MIRLISKIVLATIILVSFTYLIPSNSMAFVSLKGRIVSEGSPVPFATVTATNKTTNFQKTSTTDDNGFYRITGLPVGKYSVEVSLPSFSKTIKEITLKDFSNANANISQENTLDFEITVSSTEPAQITNANTNPPVSNTNTNEKGILKGVVRSGFFKRIPNAKIILTNKADNSIKEVSTDSKGRYQIEDLFFGDYKMEVQVSGFKKEELVLTIKSKSRVQSFLLKKEL